MNHPALLLGLVVALGMLSCTVNGETSERTKLALEALLRIEDKDLDNNAALRSAVLRIAAQVREEPELIPLVAAFDLPGMDSNLVQVVSRHPESPESSQAVRLVFDHHGESAIRAVLSPEQPLTAPLLKALTACADSRSVALVEPIVSEAGRPIETRRLAVRSLGVTPLGASRLVAMLQHPEVPTEVRSWILTELESSRVPGVREQIAGIAPGKSAPPVPLPAVASLVALRGDPERGKSVFQRPQVACNTCHQVGVEGVDFGPKLTGIGTKLGREGLIAAILEPSSGIAFGYEAWRIALRDGEEWLGLIASETDEELLLKIPGGAVHPLSKRQIVAREKLPASLMPDGLHESLTTQELVDLIEYLLSLKAQTPSGTP